MKRVRQRPDIRETGGIRRFVPPAAFVPGKPVLDDAVQPQAAAAEFPRHGEDLLRGMIALFALHIAEDPFRKHRRFSGDSGELPQYFRAVPPADDQIGHGFRRVHLKGKGGGLAAELHGAAGFDQQAPAVAAQQERNRDFHVVLIEPFRFSGIIEDAVLMRAEPGQDRGTGIFKTEDGRKHGPDDLAAALIKGGYFPVGRLPDFAGPACGNAADGPGQEGAPGLAEIFPFFVPERDRGKDVCVRRSQDNAGDAFHDFTSMHGGFLPDELLFTVPSYRRRLKMTTRQFYDKISFHKRLLKDTQRYSETRRHAVRSMSAGCCLFPIHSERIRKGETP